MTLLHPKSGAVCLQSAEKVPKLISSVLLWQHIVIALAPYHGVSPCIVIIINPFIFFIDLGAKTSTSVTAHLAPHPFFPTHVLKGNRPKNHRITGKESRFVPCQLKISCRGRMQRRINRGLIETEHSQVIRA